MVDENLQALEEQEKGYEREFRQEKRGASQGARINPGEVKNKFDRRRAAREERLAGDDKAGMAPSPPLGEFPEGRGRAEEKDKTGEDREAEQGKEQPGEKKKMTPGEMMRGLKEVRQLAKQAGEAGALGEAGEAAAQAAYQAAQMVTGKLLQAAWSSIPTLVWAIPALIYINIHFAVRYLFGSNLFCEFGQEWFPKMPGSAGLAGKGLEIAEFVGMFVLDIILFFIILIVMALVNLLVYMANNPWETVKEVGLGGLKEIWDVFH